MSKPATPDPPPTHTLSYVPCPNIIPGGCIPQPTISGGGCILPPRPVGAGTPEASVSGIGRSGSCR